MGPVEPAEVAATDTGTAFGVDALALAGAGPAAAFGVTVTSSVVVAPLTTVVTEETVPAVGAAVDTGGRPTCTMTSTVRPISTGIA